MLRFKWTSLSMSWGPCIVWRVIRGTGPGSGHTDLLDRHNRKHYLPTLCCFHFRNRLSVNGTLSLYHVRCSLTNIHCQLLVGEQSIIPCTALRNQRRSLLSDQLSSGKQTFLTWVNWVHFARSETEQTLIKSLDRVSKLQIKNYMVCGNCRLIVRTTLN